MTRKDKLRPKPATGADFRSSRSCPARVAGAYRELPPLSGRDSRRGRRPVSRKPCRSYRARAAAFDSRTSSSSAAPAATCHSSISDRKSCAAMPWRRNLSCDDNIFNLPFAGRRCARRGIRRVAFVLPSRDSATRKHADGGSPWMRLLIVLGGSNARRRARLARGRRLPGRSSRSAVRTNMEALARAANWH